MVSSVSRTDHEIGRKIAQTARRSIASMAVVDAQPMIVSVKPVLNSASVISLRERVIAVFLYLKDDFIPAGIPIAPLTQQRDQAVPGFQQAKTELEPVHQRETTFALGTDAARSGSATILPTSASEAACPTRALRRRK